MTAHQDEQGQVDRRRWLSRVSIAISAIPAVLVGIPIVGFIFGPLVRTPPEVWRPVGRIADFPEGSTSAVVLEDPSPEPWAGVVAKTGAWLRRERGAEFIAFSMDCTHLGCPVRWMAQANLFMCPCHGGVYYKNGNVAGGPPPHPLERYPVRVRQGVVEVRTTPIPITT